MQVLFSVLMGKKIHSIEGLIKGSEQVIINCEDGSKYVMYHDQNCCESVYIEDVNGFVDDMIGQQVLMAHESESDSVANDWGSQTWTFYHLATIKGYLTIRWIGESNGYYSESVFFKKINQHAARN